MSAIPQKRPVIYTLEDILDERQQVLNELREQKRIIKRNINDLIAPPRSTTKIGTFMNTFDRAIAIYDGVMVGMRVMHRSKTLFRSR